jgi:hypothetical protein
VAKGLYSYVIYLLHSFMSLIGIRPIISPDSARSRRVPTLGGYNEARGDIILQSGCLSGVLFGAIHCMGWNSLVQGPQVAWRVASILIICSPIYIFYPYRLLDTYWRTLTSLNFPRFILSSIDRPFAVVVSSVRYPAARIILTYYLSIIIYFTRCILTTINRPFYVVVSSVTYTAARIILIVLILLSLISLPRGAYDTVSWTKFIPHY